MDRTVTDRGRVGAYSAKYATKSTEAVGGLVHRLDASDLPGLSVREHIRGYVEAAWRLGGDPRLEHLRLRRWAHALAFRGHCFTKSRCYSTTFTALRRARAEYAAGRAPEKESSQTIEASTERVAEWAMVGMGLQERRRRLARRERGGPGPGVAKDRLGRASIGAAGRPHEGGGMSNGRS